MSVLGEAPPRPVDDFPTFDRPWVEALRSDHDDLRDHALSEISDLVDDLLAVELLRFARDESRPVEERGRALIALGPSLEMALDDLDATELMAAYDLDSALSAPIFEGVLASLRRLYLDASTPKEVRRRAVEAAVRAPQDWVRDAGEAAWSSGDAEWRVTAIFVFGHLREGKDHVRDAFRSEDLDLRCEAVRAVGRAGWSEYGKRVLEIARDRGSDRDLRFAAIEAVQELAPKGAEEALAWIGREKDEEIAEAAKTAREELLMFAGSFDGDLDGLDEDDFPF